MVTTNDRRLYEKGRLIRSHGQESKYYHTIFGLNYRMTDLAAVIGLNQLEKLDMFLEKRKRNAKTLTKAVEKIEGIRPPCYKE